MTARLGGGKAMAGLVREGRVREGPARDEAQDYEIRVAGHLDSCRSEWFDGMAVANLEDGETTLTGRVVDQAALHGLLGQVRDMGLTLISVRRLGRRTERRGAALE